MNMDWILLVVLLLPVAAASGWWAARLSHARATGGKRHNIHPEYFKGLNYVLNEQPDKAIEIFVKMLEADSETIETHLTLGNLFRRRGEVDRAIRIHQNLIARPNLEERYKAQALLELGLDYMRLGILDRAEALFTELVAANMLTIQAYRHLLDIYQQEKEWEKAISTARQLEMTTHTQMQSLIAQFYCELAESELTDGNEKGARNNIKRALNLDPKCVRASLMEGQINMSAGNYRAAVNAFRRIENQDPAYLSETIPLMQECYRELGTPHKYTEYLQEILQNQGGITALLYLTDDIADREGEDAAIRYISDNLRQRPTVRGVNHLMKYTIRKSHGDLNKNLSTIKELTARILSERAIYKCGVCGFDAKKLHWYCPGCKNWNTVKPIQGIYGE
ncbi:MAG: lipopolysaccharide assembly protein LapB [Gammaproteobacteria bacterium]